MDPTTFFRSANVHLVAGKGGVGKTTVTAALGLAAASLGLRVLLIEIEGRDDLAAAFGQTGLGHEATVLTGGITGGITARSLRADRALVDYLGEHAFGGLARRMVDTGLVEVVARGAPGLKDILLLGKIKQLERAGVADVIVVDAPASGHAITFLRSPRGLLDAVDAGPINSQAAEVLDLLTDPARCQVLLVTVAEETPVNETVETAFDLEEELGVHLGPVLVNHLLPVLDLPRRDAHPDAHPDAPAAGDELDEACRQAAEFRRRRQDTQRRQLDRLAELLPLPRLEIAHRFGAALQPADLDAMAAELLAAIGAL